MSAPTYLPGKDFPDREVWLSLRDTPRWLRKLISRWVHQHALPRMDSNGITIQESRFPMALGINKAKRTADSGHAAMTNSKHPAKHGSRKGIVAQRHAYYGRMIDAT